MLKKLIGPIEQLFEEKPRPHADGTVVISHALGRRAQGLGVPADSILYLPPGADSDSIRETDIQAARQCMGLSNKHRYVGYLGNIYQRDADLLFDTLQLLKAGDAKLLMVGEPGCNIDPAIRQRVHVTGRVEFDKMLDYLSCCDVLALPLSDTIANRGRWPSKVNEYVAVGRPTVACDVGDVADLMRQNDIGLLTTPDPKEFAARIDELLADPARAQAMGNRARHVAKTSYSQETMIERLEDFYKGLLGARPKQASRTQHAEH
jgi:glycosyltransferase involved in cell wall biosynthesis